MYHRVLLTLWLLTLAAAAMAQDRIVDIALPTGNYANNGGFERGTAGWEVFAGHRFAEVANDERHSGQSSLKVEGLVDDYRYVNQARVPLTPGREYTMSA